jgi:hypothetical protein
MMARKHSTIHVENRFYKTSNQTNRVNNFGAIGL